MNELYCVSTVCDRTLHSSQSVSLPVCYNTDCIHCMFCDTRHYVIVISKLGKISPNFHLALSHFGAFIAYGTSS